MAANLKAYSENLTKSEILSKLFDRWSPEIKIETIPVSQAYGRILAETQQALYDLPVVRASSMDGIAVKSELFEKGIPDTSSWRPGMEYVRADTGDDFDDAFDSVIRIEHVNMHPDGSISIQLPDGVVFERGMNVRPAGASLKKGSVVAKAGHTITALDLASLESGGITSVPVIRKPIVGFIPTGNELVTPGTVPQRGQNIDCNSTLAYHMIREMGGEPMCYPIVRDKKEELASALRRALDECDIILINGGSSKGGEDFNTNIIEEYGEMICHWVKAAPGRPMGVAVAENKPLINLSGPSIAAFYGMEWCLRPVIARAMQRDVSGRQRVPAFLTTDISAPGVIEFLCMLDAHKNEDGTISAAPANTRNSGRAPLSANAMLITELGTTMYKAGETVTIELLRPFSEI